MTARKRARLVDREQISAEERELRWLEGGDRVVQPAQPAWSTGAAPACKMAIALLMMLLARGFEAPMWAYLLPMYKNTIARVNPNATAGEFGYGPAIEAEAREYALLFGVLFCFSRPVEIIANSFIHTACRAFGSPLRTAVMKAILNQVRPSRIG